MVRSKRWIWGGLAVAAAMLAACVSVPQVRHAADPDALWRIVSTQCLVASGQQPARDCVAVWADPARRSVVLKDSHGRYQYLLIPADKVSGIESPQLQQPQTPNYFAIAWEARSFVAAALEQPLPRRYVSLALNSPHGRSQDQLHIHVDCVRPDVRAQLDHLQGDIGPQWWPLPEPLLGHRYLARDLPGEALTQDPIRLLAATLSSGDRLADYSLVAVGREDADGRPGFTLLATRADFAAGNRASGEELQDHACGLVTGAKQVLEGVR
jgi:CDP-diacylglycerol pyrophosphatase